MNRSKTVDRRALLPALAALGALPLVAASSALAQAPKAPVAKAASKAAPAAAASLPRQALIDAAKRCSTIGDVCLNHCIKLTKAGDKSLEGCMNTVRAMLPVCNAVGQLARQDAQRLKDLVKVCADVCADCEAECRKHEFHHRECKACAEACAAMVKECKAVLA
jgi:Cys-rich four helix bundle protein (predicted Tat secretion target)